MSLVTLSLIVLGCFTGLTVLAVSAGFAAERVLRHKRIFAVPLAKGQIRFELIGNAVFIVIASVAFTAALRAEIVRVGPPSLARDAATFFALLVGFQLFYWTLHRMMHTRPLLFLHRWHHRSRVTTPLSGQSMSAGEAALWMLGYVGLPLVFSLVVPIGFRGWIGYIAFNAFGNIVGHANVEPTAERAATPAAALFANPFIYHALHHARWTVNYAFMARGMDRLFGTEAPDWPELYARVSAGKPLTRLR